MSDIKYFQDKITEVLGVPVSMLESSTNYDDSNIERFGIEFNKLKKNLTKELRPTDKKFTAVRKYKKWIKKNGNMFDKMILPIKLHSIKTGFTIKI